MTNLDSIVLLQKTGFNRQVIQPITFILLVCTGLVSHSLFAKPNTEILESIKNPHFDTLRIADNASVPSTRKIYVSPVKAKFAANWVREFKGQTTDTYRQRVLFDYSQALEAHIKQKLEMSGWQVFDEPEQGVLVLKAKLTDLYIYGPQKLTREHVLVKQIGQSSMSLILEGTNKQAIFKIQDKGIAGGISNDFIETDNAINFTRFNRLMKAWAANIVTYTDTVVNPPNNT